MAAEAASVEPIEQKLEQKLEQVLVKCSNCSRAPQPEDQFVNDRGVRSKTCLKCRSKGKKRTFTDEQKEQRLANGREKKYYQSHRDRKRAADEDAYLAHNASVMRDYRVTHAEELLQWNRTNVKRRMDSIKAGAADRGIAFELTDEECKAMMVEDGKCFYCGEPDPDRVTGLDRMDSAGAYAAGNVVPCCHTCNNSKQNHARIASEWSRRAASTVWTMLWATSKPTWSRHVLPATT